MHESSIESLQCAAGGTFGQPAASSGAFSFGGAASSAAAPGASQPFGTSFGESLQNLF